MSSFEKLQDHLHIVTPHGGMCAALAQAFRVDRMSPADLLLTFLKGQGIPLPEELEEARDCLPPVVLPQLDSFADDPGFRARMFAWAASGTTSLLDDDRIDVSIRVYSITVLRDANTQLWHRSSSSLATEHGLSCMQILRLVS